MTHLTTQELAAMEKRLDAAIEAHFAMYPFNADQLKSIIHAAREVEKVKRERCEHCHSDKIYHGPPGCPGCGAPNCCQVCCRTTQLEADVELLTHKLEEATIMLEQTKSALELADWKQDLACRKLQDAEKEVEELKSKICIH